MLKRINSLAHMLVLFTFIFYNTVFAVDNNSVYEFYLIGDKIVTDIPMDRWGQYVPVRAYFEYCGYKVDWRRENDGTVSALIFNGEGDKPVYIFNTKTNGIGYGDVEGLIYAGGTAPIIRNDRMQFSTSILENDFMDSSVFYDENGIMKIARRSYFRTNETNVLKSVPFNDANKIICTILFDGDVDVSGLSYNGQKAYFTGNLNYKDKNININGYYEQEKFVIYKKDNPEVILFNGKQAHDWGIKGDFYDEESGEIFRVEFVLNLN